MLSSLPSAAAAILTRLPWRPRRQVIKASRTCPSRAHTTTPFVVHISRSLLPLSRFNVLPQVLILDVCHRRARFLISARLRKDKSHGIRIAIIGTPNIRIAEPLRQLLDPVAQSVAGAFLAFALPVVLQLLMRIIIQLRHRAHPQILLLLITLMHRILPLQAKLRLPHRRIRTLNINRTVVPKRLI